ncbi:MAG: UDP-N-acetylmuramate:L-alanyl-gamma-D-glutamyl-meso-diaminopimelate ligase [Chromatocurvus sp.]
MSRHIHILGICGTFMGGIALLAQRRGFRVTGSDANVYPPMSTQLEAAGIVLQSGYLPGHLRPAPDQLVVGNALSRGNPAVEYALDAGIPYTSGPQWLAENILQNKWVLAVAGTHGKTSTSSMLAWILEYAGLAPGFLIGGVPADFGVSAREGESDFFVVEADEYDTAFFDKRSKFVHYRPRTLAINNLEYDHADIFPDLMAIQRQFHHLVRCIPGSGRIVRPRRGDALDAALAMGCWTPLETFAIATDAGEADWQARLLTPDGSELAILHAGQPVGRLAWDQLGRHNAENALSAIAAARHVGVPPSVAVEALRMFRGVRRRMELLGEVAGVRVYDDFAHHPTAIATTLQGLRASAPQGRILALIEPRSNTMRLGRHREQLAASASLADQVLWYQPPGMDWSLNEVADGHAGASVHDSIDSIVDAVADQIHPNDRIVIMSNGGFAGIRDKLMQRLQLGVTE